MEKEKFIITTEISQLKIFSNTVCSLIPYCKDIERFTFYVDDKMYTSIILGAITNERTFCIKQLILTFSHFGAGSHTYQDVITDINITKYDQELFFYIDNKNSQLVINEAYIPYFKLDGLDELQSQDELYPIITKVSFVTIIERPL